MNWVIVSKIYMLHFEMFLSINRLFTQHIPYIILFIQNKKPLLEKVKQLEISLSNTIMLGLIHAVASD